VYYAVEIRLRAERRLGQMMEAQPKATGGGDKRSEEYHRVIEKPSDPSGNVPLDDAGIDKNLAHRARKLRAKSDAEFEEFIRDTRAEVKLGVERLEAPRNKSSATKLGDGN
jgi:hypothetical protein